MGGSVSTCVKLFERLLSSLLDGRRIPEANVDVLKGEYASFVQEVHDNSITLKQFQNYTVSEQRVDCFLASHLKNSQHPKLWYLIKCLLVLSHGQAGVERGFSINKEITEYNFKERSVVSLRIIYDHIQASGGTFRDQILFGVSFFTEIGYMIPLVKKKVEEII